MVNQSKAKQISKANQTNKKQNKLAKSKAKQT